MIGIVYALLSAALFGLSAPFARMLPGAVSPWLLAELLYLGSGFRLALVRLVWRSKEAGLSAAIYPGWVPRCFRGVVGPVLLLFGLAPSSASAASLRLTVEDKTRQDPVVTS